ncbi:MAG: DUF1343 domain-containing protein [Candidatus Sumerlaeia bacterium]|nr:DUF1343 domain-containing protein [Candidatus Sumerlaeia bacterium]
MMRRALLGIVAGVLALASAACSTSGAAGKRMADPLVMENPVVKPGIEVLLSEPGYFEYVRGKRVGLITNATGVDSKLRSTIDLLHRHPDVNLVALFGPEHGVRGEAYGGDKISDYVDPRTGVTVYSLYGATRRPRAEWLENIDVMLYDIQDVGATSYTYIYTMSHAMEECAKFNIPFIVLDRPNPCGADYVDGMVLDTTQFKSFVGYYDVAYMYGLTPGETAMLFNGEFIEDKVELIVVPMRGYERWMRQWDTGLPFVPTSTHIPNERHAFYYSLTGIIGEIRRGVNIGVGYTLPFECIAAPWIDRDELAEVLNARNIPGVRFRPISYTPKYVTFADEPIQGVHIHITDYRKVRPVTTQIHIMTALQELHGDKGLFEDEMAGRSAFDRVCGTSHVRKMVLEGKSAEEIIATFQPRLNEFVQTRAKYLIYP